MPAQGKVNGKAEWTQTKEEPAASWIFSPGDISSLGQAKVRTVNEDPDVKPVKISIEAIYRAPEAGSIELRSAMRLVPEALNWVESAIKAFDAGERVEADDSMLHVQSLMPELFCCRNLGDGFGLVINAVLSSFENRGGSPMERTQLEAIRRVLIAIRSEPRISFDRALDYISAMEEAGLRIDPAGTEEVAEFLSE